MLTKMLSFIGATIGGGIGWWAGEKAGFMTAFMVSMIGTGLGIYFGWGRRHSRVGRRADMAGPGSDTLAGSGPGMKVADRT